MDSATLRDRLRGIVSPVASNPGASGFLTPEPSATGVSRTDQHLERTLGGAWRDGCFVVERRVDPAMRYGRALVGDLSARVGAAASAAPLIASGAPARLPLLFFDLETTGLSGGAGTQAFLIGCGWGTPK